MMVKNQNLLETLYDYFNFCRDIAIQEIKKCFTMFKGDYEVKIKIQIHEFIFGKNASIIKEDLIYDRSSVFCLSHP